MIKDKRLYVACKMPKLYHTLPGEKFDIKKSEVIKWLIKQPEILNYIFDKVKSEMVYNYEDQTWQGVDYDKN